MSVARKKTDNNFLNNADPNILPSTSILAPLLKRPFMLFFDQFVVCPKLTTTVQTILMFIQSITTDDEDDDDDSQRQIRRRKQTRNCCQNTSKSRPTKLAKNLLLGKYRQRGWNVLKVVGKIQKNDNLYISRWNTAMCQEPLVTGYKPVQGWWGGKRLRMEQKIRQ